MLFGGKDVGSPRIGDLDSWVSCRAALHADSIVAPPTLLPYECVPGKVEFEKEYLLGYLWIRSVSLIQQKTWVPP